jgi:hypothetical protein
MIPICNTFFKLNCKGKLKYVIVAKKHTAIITTLEINYLLESAVISALAIAKQRRYMLKTVKERSKNVISAMIATVHIIFTLRNTSRTLLAGIVVKLQNCMKKIQ